MYHRTLIAAAFAALLPGLALAGNLMVNFGNNSWDALSGLEYRPAGSGDYLPLALPGDGLAAGDFAELMLPDGEATCTYDLRFTKADGSQHERAAVNLCAETYYHFADE